MNIFKQHDMEVLIEKYHIRYSNAMECSKATLTTLLKRGLFDYS